MGTKEANTSTSLSSLYSLFPTIFRVHEIWKGSQLPVAALKLDKIVMGNSVKVSAQGKQKGEQDTKMYKEWD